MKAIPKNHSSYQYVVIEDLPDAQRVPFLAWLVGQTIPEIVSELPKICAYYWDYENWYNHWVYGDVAKNYD